jgi:hypothetical protein
MSKLRMTACLILVGLATSVQPAQESPYKHQLFQKAHVLAKEGKDVVFSICPTPDDSHLVLLGPYDSPKANNLLRAGTVLRWVNPKTGLDFRRLSIEDNLFLRMQFTPKMKDILLWGSDGICLMDIHGKSIWSIESTQWRKLLWRGKNLGDAPTLAIAPSGELIVAGNRFGEIIAIKPQTAEVVWKRKLDLKSLKLGSCKACRKLARELSWWPSHLAFTSEGSKILVLYAGAHASFPRVFGLFLIYDSKTGNVIEESPHLRTTYLFSVLPQSEYLLVTEFGGAPGARACAKFPFRPGDEDDKVFCSFRLLTPQLELARELISIGTRSGSRSRRMFGGLCAYAEGPGLLAFSWGGRLWLDPESREVIDPLHQELFLYRVRDHKLVRLAWLQARIEKLVFLQNGEYLAVLSSQSDVYIFPTSAIPESAFEQPERYIPRE